jgi:hypothetical protein
LNFIEFFSIFLLLWLLQGLIEFMPEFMKLISEINDVLAQGTKADPASVGKALSPASAATFEYLPKSIKEQLVLDRDPHGNVQVRQIPDFLLSATIYFRCLRAKGVFD